MKIAVLVKLVPDLVEEINIDPGGNALDMTWMRMVINEFDDHAIEQAIIMKERDGSHVTVVAPNFDGIDDVLFTAGAKNADQLIKLDGNFQDAINNHALAKAFSALINELQPDLILTGVQANNDLDGSLGSLIAGHLDYPYIGYISNITSQDGSLKVQKEYPGGLLAEMEIKLPAVLGIQAAEQPPRYVAVSKVRQAMKTSSIEEQSAPELDPSGGIETSRMYPAEAGEKATMLTGSADDVADQLVDILKKTGLA
jgi:electron transfer flavoprotein beta subunit